MNVCSRTFVCNFTNFKNGVIFLNDYKNQNKMDLKALMAILSKAKNKDSNAILFLINKYKPLMMKYSLTYNLKNYDKDDMMQIGAIALINAIEKYDMSHGENFIDCYLITSIINTYKNLARKNIKYQSDSSLNIVIDEYMDIQSLLIDDYDLEDDLIKNMQHNTLKALLTSLTPDESLLIKVAYLDDNSNLYKYCTENNLNYHRKRRQLIKLLSKLKAKLK